MIEKLKHDGSYYTDEAGCSWDTKSDYLESSELHFCGCGRPKEALRLVRDILHLLDNRKRSEVDKLLPTEGIYYFVLYQLNHMGFTEHGTSIGSSWLTARGKELLAVKVLGAPNRAKARKMWNDYIRENS